MADKTATEDTTVSEDTSTNEDTQDAEANLEDIEVSEKDISAGEDDETEEPESKDEAATESEDKEQSKEDESVGENVPETDVEVTEEDTTPETANEAARKAFAEREAERKKSKAEAQQEYLADRSAYDLALERGLTEQEAQIEANRDLALRQLQVDAYNNRTEANNNKLSNGIDKAVASIDLFQTGSTEVKEELARSLDDFERMYVQRDANGDPVQVTGDVYEYLQNKADSIRRLTGVGARKQETDKADAKSRAMTPPAKTPKESAKDPDLEAFDEEAAK